MDKLSIAIIGYISGAFAGGFIALIALIYAYMYINEKSIDEVEYVSDIYNLLFTYYEEHTVVFSVSFLLGFLSGMGVFASKSS
jgi:uncharacterized membrane protein